MNNIPWNWWLEGEISFFDWPNFRGYVREGIAFKLCRLATKPCTACRVWAKQKRKGSMEAVCSSAHEEVVWFDHWTDVDIYKYWSFKVKKHSEYQTCLHYVQNTRCMESLTCVYCDTPLSLCNLMGCHSPTAARVKTSSFFSDWLNWFTVNGIWFPISLLSLLCL